MQTLNENEATQQQTCSECCCKVSFLNSQSSQNTKAKHTNSSSECRHTFAATTTSSIFPNTHFTNHESLPSLDESFIEFNKVFPHYSDTQQVDYVREKEYSHLLSSNHTCLDYIGIGLFFYSQQEQQQQQQQRQQKEHKQKHHETSKTQLCIPYCAENHEFSQHS